MQIPPLSVLQTLPTANYLDPQVHSPATSIVNLIFCPLIFGLIALRVYTRLCISKNLGADDVLIVLAMVPATAFSIISILAELKYGWDRHVWDVEPEHIQLGLQLILTTECLFAAACTLTKLSMLLFVRRIMFRTTGPMRLVISIAMGIIACQGFIFCFVVIFQCRPVSDYWLLTFDAQPNCLNQPVNLLIAGIINTITDFLVVLVPIPIVVNLNLPRRQQIIITLIFAAGFVVCIAGIARTIFTYEVSLTYDQTWVGFSVWLTAAVELYVGLLCASIPALKPLFSHYLPALLESTLHLSQRAKSAPAQSGSSITVTTTTSQTNQLKDLEANVKVHELDGNHIAEVTISGGPRRLTDAKIIEKT